MDYTLKDLEQEEEEAKQLLEEIRAAIRVHKRMSGKKTDAQKPRAELQQEPINTTGDINLDDLDIPSKADKKPTLNDEIKNVISRLGNQEFTVNHIEAALRQLGKGSNAKHFKNRIATNVKKLLDDGYLERTFEGKGFLPHKYKRSTSKVKLLIEKSNKLKL